MKSELKIIPTKSTKGLESYEKGNCFEKIIRTIIEIQQFHVDPNVQFTGLEIDLIAKHKFDNNRTLYVECKAKEKVKSTELKNFGFNVLMKNPEQAYFIHTIELDKQASGLKIETFDNDPRLRNVTFYGPEKTIALLTESQKIKKINLDKIGFEITQQTLLISYLGDYFIFIGQNNLAYPTHFFVYDAHTGIPLESIENLNEILTEIPELSSLIFQPIKSEYESKIKVEKSAISQDFEIIAEIQAGEEWYDYKPASPDYFVGREALKTEIFNFFKKVNRQETSKRAFYLKSNSGWGKSSLINSIKGTCGNKYYRNRFYAVAYDCRSASTENFVAKAFEKAIEKVFSDGFIDKALLSNDKISFTSNYNLLDSDYVRKLLKELQKQGKTLIVIFDQFEDVFRKTHIFKYFYKFLSDVGEIQSNIIVGFSWKSEFLIQAESDTYSWFQQAKEQSTEFLVPEFGVRETNGIIKQLENSLKTINKKSGELNNELQNRLTENSQGFPWLIKKLCIHVYNQIKSGKNQDDLIDENLNIESLFKSDLADVVEKEQKALLLVANKAITGNLFDETDISEFGLSKEIKSLIDKRLIIRSGYNYNVYWDIFRDYLVSGQVPQIRRGYIFKQSPASCLKIFLSFSTNRRMSFEQLQKSQTKRLGTGALGNILIELRNLELIKKVEGRDEFYVPEEIEISESFFKDEAIRKINDFSTYQKLKDIDTKTIEINQVTHVLKEIFKSVSHKDKTWKTYSNYFVNWLKYSGLDLSNRIQEPQKGKSLKDYEKEKDTLFLASNPFQAFLFFNELLNTGFKATPQNKDFIRDCRILKIIELRKGKIILTQLGEEFKTLKVEKDFNIKLSELAINLSKIKECVEIFKLSPCTSTQFIEMYPHFFEKSKSNATKIVYATKIISWARFIIWVSEGFPTRVPLIHEENSKKTVLKKAKKSPRKRVVIGDNGQAARKANYYSEWLKIYGLLVKYKLKYGHVDVPAREKFEGVAIGTWVVRQRAVKDTLSTDQKEKMEELGFDWNPNDTQWFQMYAVLKEYYTIYGNSNVPVDYRENRTLGRWVFSQRQNRKKDILSPDKIQLLNELKFIWSPQELNFLENLELLKSFFDRFNHFNVPSNKEFQHLNNWFNSQKRKYYSKSLSAEKIERFKEIGYEFPAQSHAH